MTDNPGAYSVMTIVGPRALAILLEPDGDGPITATADGIAAKILDAARADGRLAELVEAAVDVIARYVVDDLGDDLDVAIARAALLAE